MTEREGIIIKAIGDVLAKRLDGLKPGARTLTVPAQEVTVPAPEVYVRAPEVKVTNDVQSPEVHVTNNVPVPEVKVVIPQGAIAVDMRPVAEAIVELATSIAGQVAAQLVMQAEAFEKLIGQLKRETVNVHAVMQDRKPVAFRLEVDADGRRRIVPEN